VLSGAVKRGHYSIVKRLLEHGTQVNRRFHLDHLRYIFILVSVQACDLLLEAFPGHRRVCVARELANKGLVLHLTEIGQLLLPNLRRPLHSVSFKVKVLQEFSNIFSLGLGPIVWMSAEPWLLVPAAARVGVLVGVSFECSAMLAG
jgi:hypothetical protein